MYKLTMEIGPPKHSFILESIFNSSEARVLDFLILNERFDYSFSDISRLSSISPRTLQRALPILLEAELVTRTRKSGKNYMYEFNRSTEFGKALVKFVNESIKRNICGGQIEACNLKDND